MNTSSFKGMAARLFHSGSPDIVAVKEIIKQFHERMKHKISEDGLQSKIYVWRGDITKLKVDAIVNAANERLLGGGGVDGAIHDAAGRQLLDECRELGGCETGNAKITKGYHLPAKHVIHAVGPIYCGRKRDKKELSSCYKRSLDLMLENNLKSIAFPCISTGIYGYPNEAAAEVAFHTVMDWLAENRSKVEAVIFCLFLKKDVEIYGNMIRHHFPIPTSESFEDDDEDNINNRKSDVNNTSKEPNGHDTKTDSVCEERSPTEAQDENTVHTDVEMANNGGDPKESIKNEHGDTECEMEFSTSDGNKNQKSPPNSNKREGVSHQELSPKERAEWVGRFQSLELESHRKPVLTDTEYWQKEQNFPSLKLVGGLDISYHKTDDTACVSLAILSFPKLELVYEDSTIEPITTPYIPGYLAYREAGHFYSKIQKVRDTKYCPQIILVDGNGILHPRKYGSAVMVGVDSDIPTIGVAKNLMIMEECGIVRDKVRQMSRRGSTDDITTDDGEVLGRAVRSSDGSHKPVFVSIGHKCSLDTAMKVTLACCQTRVPEPIRQADHLSKMRLKKEYKRA